jgi:hypothetical protein
VRVVAVAEHGDIDQVRRRRPILPDLGIDVAEVDLFVEPTAGPVLASVGNEVWETADAFRRAAVFSLPPSPAEAVVVVAEVMVPAEIVAQIARLRSPTADGALPSLC